MRNPPIILIVLPLVVLFCLGLATTIDRPGCLAVKPGVIPVNSEGRAAMVGCWLANLHKYDDSHWNEIRLVKVEKDEDLWVVRYHGAFKPLIDPIVDKWPVYPLIEFEITESNFVEINWDIQP